MVVAIEILLVLVGLVTVWTAGYILYRLFWD